jgi:hypothetical protein
MKHLKKFENFSKDPINEELLGLGKKDAYKKTIEFLQGDSKQSKEIKDIYEKNFKGKSDSDIRKSNNLFPLMQRITRLGAIWAKENKMDDKDYTFKQIQTVLEENFDRKFRGGPNLTSGE